MPSEPPATSAPVPRPQPGTAATGPRPAARANGIQGSAQYVPGLRGVVIANRHDGDVYFLRTPP
jgi:hypothetical protein